VPAAAPALDSLTHRRRFVNEYMVTNETLLHKNPTTGKPQVIGLGWLDDSMTPHGPTEEAPPAAHRLNPVHQVGQVLTRRVLCCQDSNYMADCGYSAADMKLQVASYRASMTALVKKVVPMGGYWWQVPPPFPAWRAPLARCPPPSSHRMRAASHVPFHFGVGVVC
jgi:hypothetical protein